MRVGMGQAEPEYHEKANATLRHRPKHLNLQADNFNHP